MRVRILGAAAGGGFPQWNCHCPVCRAGREGERATPRTQSSIAVRGADGPWFLVNASPDVRQQLATLHDGPAEGVRSPPVAGVILTDAEIDHTAGLLLMRESATPLRVWGEATVGEALRDGFPVLRTLAGYCGVRWHALPEGRELPLEGSSLTVTRFVTGADAPLYAPAMTVPASGLTITDRRGGAILTYAPGLARLEAGVRARMAASDLVLVDGTFWHDDELARHGISTRTARDMGHLTLSGPDGTLAALAAMDRPRRVLVHINNTNPILLHDSAERAEVHRSGVEIGADGMEFTL